jgi:hypothetical protein
MKVFCTLNADFISATIEIHIAFALGLQLSRKLLLVLEHELTLWM